MRRMPWHQPCADTRPSGMSFVGSPRVRCVDDGRLWLVTTTVHKGNLEAGEAVRFWLRWRHDDALADDVVAPVGLLLEDITLSYAIGVDIREGCGCLNSFVRVSPEFSFDECADGTLAFGPIAYTSEIFSEWRSYPRALRGVFRRFAHEGSRQYHASRVGMPDGATAVIAATFVNHAAERRRVARTALWAVLISVFSSLLLDGSDSMAPPRSVSQGMFIGMNLIAGIVLIAYASLDYVGAARNEIFTATLQKLSRRRWPRLSPTGLGIDSGARQRSERTLRGLRVTGLWVLALGTWVAVILDYRGVINAGAVVVVQAYALTILWLGIVLKNYGCNRRPLEV